MWWGQRVACLLEVDVVIAVVVDMVSQLAEVQNRLEIVQQVQHAKRIL
jgi:hypothetical protein